MAKSEAEREVDRARKCFESGQTEEAIEKLSSLFQSYPLEPVLLGKEAAVALIYELPEERQESLIKALESKLGFRVLSEAAEVTKKTIGGRKVRFTHNADGELIELCLVDEGGVGQLPFLLLNPKRQKGMIRYRSTVDVFSKGKAMAATAYHDGSHEAPMGFEAWCEQHIAWFTKES
jgi:hypothetical protein